MNLSNAKYNKYALVQEMLETADVVRNMPVDRIAAKKIVKEKILLSGEGSSRIFPAKNLIATALRHGFEQNIITENGTQCLEYDLQNFQVFVASNSGKTAEGVRLIRHVKTQGAAVFGIVAHDKTPIQQESDDHYLLTCGNENAVAATKSVLEQALFYDILFRAANNLPMPDLSQLADKIQQTLETDVPEEIIAAAQKSPVIYFSGRNNGVAEELRLKTNEITRKKSDYLEGTYAVHGIEEVMDSNELVIVVDPFAQETDKFAKVLQQGVGMNVAAIAALDTGFLTYRIPSMPEFDTYLQLAAGWNILVEIGIAMGVDLDKPVRARKVGNEFAG